MNVSGIIMCAYIKIYINRKWIYQTDSINNFFYLENLLLTQYYKVLYNKNI